MSRTGFVNLASWTTAINTWSTKVVPAESTKVQRAVALELLSRVVLKTPVDTGRARGNWQLTVNTTTDSVLETVDKEGAATSAAGLGELSKVTPFGYVALQNNVPYILALEEGSSSQAPGGMLAVSLDEVEAVFPVKRVA